MTAAKYFSCEGCLEGSIIAQPVNAPSSYIFNYELVVDVFESVDEDNARHSCLSCVHNGTTCHVVWMVSVGGGQPKSSRCLSKFVGGWA